MNRHDLDVGAVGVHVGNTFLRCEPQLGRVDGHSFTVTHNNARPSPGSYCIPCQLSPLSTAFQRPWGIKWACTSIVLTNYPLQIGFGSPAAYNPSKISRFFHRIASFSSCVMLSMLSIQETGQSWAMS